MNMCEPVLWVHYWFRGNRTARSYSPSWEALACSLVLLAMNFTFTGSVHAHQPNQQAKTTSHSTVTFRFKGMRDGFTKNGVPFYLTVLSASDGAIIYAYTIPYHNASDADQEVERMVHLSAEIIRRSNETDKKGRIIGRLFLIRLSSDKSRKSLVWLVWNDKDTVHELGSDSLNDLLVLEHMPSANGRPPK